ncbi:MAG: hypothetical protein HC926_01595 [Synechococcaceae cyanobacterium SM2_3_60]|nr:hypothetical protein [Synechococcaceae cyanobacterium SM2_3_60]
MDWQTLSASVQAKLDRKRITRSEVAEIISLILADQHISTEEWDLAACIDRCIAEGHLELVDE